MPKKKKKVPQIELLPSGSYHTRVMIAGKSHSITAESPQEVLSQYYTIVAGGEIEKHLNKNPCDLTLGEAVDRFIESRVVSCSPATIRGYQVVRRNAHKSLMDLPVRKISDADFQRSINAASKKQTGKTVKNQWTVIQSALKEICGREVKMQMPPVVANQHEYLTAEQIPVFVEALKGERIELQIAALLGLHSLRRSEIIDVTWNDIDLKAKIIHVRGSAVYDGDCMLVHKKTNKTSKSQRDIPFMIPMLEEVLRKAERKSKYIVTIAPQTIQRGIDRVCEKAELPKVGCHGLRHSFASLAFSKKINLPLSVVQELGGWDDVNTVRKIYTHVSRQDLADAAQAMSIFYQNSLQNSLQNDSD